MNSVPSWVCDLKPDDELIIVFSFTGNTLYATVLENDPRDKNSASFGILTVRYMYNNLVKEEDLLYDDYTKDTSYQHGWHAYPVT